MELGTKASLAGIVAIALLVAGFKDIGLIAGGVFLTFAAPWYAVMLFGD